MILIPLLFYFRFVDDIILAALPLFHNIILNTFSSFYRRLRFIVEISKNNCINFLDISTMINEEFIEFNQYSKPTFSGTFFNFLSQHSICHKKGIIYGLINIIFKLSHSKFLQKNFNLIIRLFLNNPIDFTFFNIRTRLEHFI